MDLASRLWRLCAAADRPGAGFLFARREVADQAQQLVGRRHQSVQPAFSKAQRFEKFCRFLRLQLGDLVFDLRTDYENLAAFLRRIVAHSVHHRVAFRSVVLADIRRVEDRLRRQQVQLVEIELLLVVLAREGARAFARFQMRIETFQHIVFADQLLIVCLRALRRLLHAAFHRLHIRKDQLQIDRLNVADRIDAAVHVDHVRVLEAAHNVHNRVAFADVREKLVAQPLAVACALHKPSDVDKFDRRWHDLLALGNLRQHPPTLIRHSHHAHIRVDRAERIVRRFRPGFCDAVEKRALTNIRKANNA